MPSNCEFIGGKNSSLSLQWNWKLGQLKIPLKVPMRACVYIRLKAFNGHFLASIHIGSCVDPI